MELSNTVLITGYWEWINHNGGLFPDEGGLMAQCNLAHGIFRNWITANGNTLPDRITPIEPHPYLADTPINFGCDKLIIGTFPPISYLADQLNVAYLINPAGNIIAAPAVPFFHGNRLSLWRFCSDTQLQLAISRFDNGEIGRYTLKEEINQFLGRNSTAITDIVVHGQRAEINADDENLWNLELNVELVLSLCSADHGIRTLIFTNSVNAGGVKIYQHGNQAGQINITKRDAFSLFLRACQLAGIGAEIAPYQEEQWIPVHLDDHQLLNAHTKCKLVFRCKLTLPNEEGNRGRQFIVITPPSPSGGARRGLANNVNRLLYNAENPGAPVDQFRRAIWHNAVVTNDHQQISLWQ